MSIPVHEGQLSFGMARTTDPETSHGAAVIALHSAAEHRRVALHHHATCETDGLTDFELADLTGIKQTSIGVRRGELVKLGLVEVARDDNGCILRRPSFTRNPDGTKVFGAPSRVWRVTYQGMDSWRRDLPIPKPPRKGQ